MRQRAWESVAIDDELNSSALSRGWCEKIWEGEMEWWWSVPAAAGLSMLGVFYRSRNPRMSGGEGGPAFETFYDVRECLRGGVTPILPAGWQYWRYELMRRTGRKNAAAPVQQNVTKLKIGDRVWLLMDQDCRQKNVVKAFSGEEFIGFVKVGRDCLEATVVGQTAAFVQSIDKIISGRPSVELLVLQSPVPLESSQRETRTARLASAQSVGGATQTGARRNIEQSGQAKARGSGK